MFTAGAGVEMEVRGAGDPPAPGLLNDVEGEAGRLVVAVAEEGAEVVGA